MIDDMEILRMAIDGYRMKIEDLEEENRQLKGANDYVRKSCDRQLEYCELIIKEQTDLRIWDTYHSEFPVEENYESWKTYEALPEEQREGYVQELCAECLRRTLGGQIPPVVKIPCPKEEGSE